MQPQPFIAITDKAWFDYLAARAGGETLDEVNFWSPMSLRPLKRLDLGAPVFFRLKSPHHAIAGYGRRCAFTGERTELVLDAAHIQPYLGPRSNHLQNGLLLTKEFHTLFDHGYVTVSPDHQILVSPRLRAEWRNGKRYYEFDGKPLRSPDIPLAVPSPAALAWHRERVFRT
jgi:predicted restriction endonuclease